jgi:hypothetical protein
MKFAVIFPLVLFLFFATSHSTAAQEPTPTPNFDMPYNFQPVDFESGEENPVFTGLGDIIADVSFMNRFGSMAVTVWAILDNFAGGGVLGYLVIFLMGLVIIKWAAGFVYNKPISEKLDASAAADVVGDLDPETGRQARRVINIIKNRPRF